MDIHALFKKPLKGPVMNGSSYNQSDCPPFPPLPPFSPQLAIFFGIPACCIIVITVLGNFLVLTFKANIGKRQTALLIWNLGLADFLVGIIVLPLGVAHVIGQRWPFPRWMCKLWAASDVIFCTASIVTLCVISVDRYIGVTRPLQYKMIVTKTRIVLSIVLIWLFSCGTLLSTLRYQTDQTCVNPNTCRVSDELQYVVHSVVTAFFLPAIITLILYWKIYVIARERERCLKEGFLITMGESFFTACVVNEPMRVHYGRQRHVSKQQNIIRMHKLIAKTLGVVVSAFILCWLPYFSIYLIGYHCNCVLPLVGDILTWLGYCNSMLNPIIYAFTIREFKHSVRSTLSFWHRKVGRGSGNSRGKTGNKQCNYHLPNGDKAKRTKIQQYPKHLQLYAKQRHSAITAALIEAGLVGHYLEPVWSAKAYSVLVDPRTTAL